MSDVTEKIPPKNVPKGQMSAFQRWEMASFGDERPAHVAEQQVATNLAARINREELAKLKEITSREAYAAGYQQAYLVGLQEGKDAGFAASKAEIDVQVEQMKQLISSTAEQISAASAVMGKDLLSLAIELAEAMLKARIAIDPEVILPIVQEAIDQLPSVQQPAQIMVNPEDADILKNRIGEELSKTGWRVTADHHIERGGCRLETGQNSVDATLATRWDRLTAVLKKTTAE